MTPTDLAGAILRQDRDELTLAIGEELQRGLVSIVPLPLLGPVCRIAWNRDGAPEAIGHVLAA